MLITKVTEIAKQAGFDHTRFSFFFKRLANLTSALKWQNFIKLKLLLISSLEMLGLSEFLQEVDACKAPT